MRADEVLLDSVPEVGLRETIALRNGSRLPRNNGLRIVACTSRGNAPSRNSVFRRPFNMVDHQDQPWRLVGIEFQTEFVLQHGEDRRGAGIVCG